MGIHGYAKREIVPIPVHEDTVIPTMRYSVGFMIGKCTFGATYRVFPHGIRAIPQPHGRQKIRKEGGDLICLCKNTPDGSGFEPCLEDGTVVEPLRDGPWKGKLYICLQCGRIVDQYSLEVIGQREL